MNLWILSSHWQARAALIFAIACFYAGCVLLNNTLLFSWAQDGSTYRYWVYLPGGFRLVLIMLFGWRGLVGVTIAVAGISYSDLVPEITSIVDAVIAAIVRTTSIWLAIDIYGKITGVRSPWENLTWIHVPFLALFVTVITNLAVTFYFVLLGIEPIESLGRNVSTWVIGDTAGTIIVLAILIKLRQGYLEWKSAQALPSEQNRKSNR